jgi:hypothetical protein
MLWLLAGFAVVASISEYRSGNVAVYDVEYDVPPRSLLFRVIGYVVGVILLIIVLVVVVAVIALPFIWVWNYLRERKRDLRIAEGKCPSCGYDLRESRERCPECGAEIVRKIEATT